MDLLTPTLVAGFRSQGPPRKLFDASYIRTDITLTLIFIHRWIVQVSSLHSVYHAWRLPAGSTPIMMKMLSEVLSTMEAAAES